MQIFCGRIISQHRREGRHSRRADGDGFEEFGGDERVQHGVAGRMGARGTPSARRRLGWAMGVRLGDNELARMSSGRARRGRDRCHRSTSVR